MTANSRRPSSRMRLNVSSGRTYSRKSSLSCAKHRDRNGLLVSVDRADCLRAPLLERLAAGVSPSDATIFAVLRALLLAVAAGGWHRIAARLEAPVIGSQSQRK